MSEQEHKNLTAAFFKILPLFVVGIAVSLTFASVAWASDLSAQSVIGHINQSRAQEGLGALVENKKLSQAATAKAEDMIKHDYFSHTSPAGLDPWHWLKEADYQYKAAGENLAVNFIDSGTQHEAWMASATHRNNILNPRYEEVGVAVVEGEISGKETLVTVSLYARPAVAVGGPSGAVPQAVPERVGAVQGVNTEALATLPAVALRSPGTSFLFQASFFSAFFVTALSVLSGPLAFLARSYRAFVPLKKPPIVTAAIS